MERRNGLADRAERYRILKTLDIAAAREALHDLISRFPQARNAHGEAVERDEVILAALHKARVNSPTRHFTKREKSVSYKWLADHGYKSTMFGEGHNQ